MKKLLHSLNVVFVVWIIYTFHNCERNSTKEDLKSNSKIIENNKIIDSLSERLVNSEKQKDSIKIVGDLRLHKLNKLKLSNEAIKKEVEFNKKAFRELIKQDKGEIALYYGKRYNLPNDAKTTEIGTEISDYLAYLNISELWDLDGAKKEISNLNLMLIEKDSLVLDFANLWKLTEAQKNDALKQFQLEKDNFKIASDALEKEKEANSKEVVFRFFIGGGAGIDRNLNQVLYKANAGFQTRNSNVYFASFNRIGEIDYFVLDANFSLFKINGKKK